MGKEQNIYNLQKHLHKDKLCFKCNDIKEHINEFKIRDRGYGSIFQGDSFTIHLCDECKKLIDLECFNNNAKGLDNNFNKYEKESELYSFMKSFIIGNQEYVFNCDNEILPKIDRYDWINSNIVQA